MSKRAEWHDDWVNVDELRGWREGVYFNDFDGAREGDTHADEGYDYDPFFDMGEDFYFPEDGDGGDDGDSN